MRTTRVRDGGVTQGHAVALTAILAVLMSLLVAPAWAVIEEQDFVVSDDPVTATPHVLDESARILATIGSRVYVGGYFTQIQDTTGNGGTVYDQPYLFAFDRTTGLIDTGFMPTLNGQVEGLTPSADGQSLFVGGWFTSVDGVTRFRLAKLDAVTGALDPTFDPVANSRVSEVIQRNGRLFVAGYFSSINSQPRSLVAELDPVTGDPLDTVQHTFTEPDGGGSLNVYSMDVTPDGSRMIAIGNFGAVDGQSLEQIVQIDVSTNPSTIFDWSTTRYAQNLCFGVFDTYMRDVEVAPDGSYFVVATTGGGVLNSLCDTAARWETSATGSGQQPTWVSSTGGDTLYSVGVTGDVVYAGGHQRWMNNPFGRDRAAAGAVSREGLAALDARNGVPFSWDPGRQRGVGVFDFMTASEGLYAVSDTERWGNFEYHARLARFPATGGTQLPVEAPGEIPGTLMQLAPDTGVSNPGYLYRVNAGGPLLGGTDGGIDWAADTDATSPYRNSGSNAAGWSAVPAVDGTVPPTTPTDLYSSERWDPSSGDEMMWEFPVDAGTDVQVRLYFANRCTCTDQPGERIFDVSIDGATLLDDLDLTAVHGDDVGTMYSFDITSDGLVDIDFGHNVENPLVNGIEIVDPALLTAPSDTDVRMTEFDGNATGLSSTITGNSFVGVRGGFMLSGELFAAQGNGTLTRQTFDGTTLSTPESLDLNGLTSNEFPLSTLTGLTYDPLTGRMLYTVQGSTSLFQRGFLPESGIVSAENITSQPSLAGVDWSQVRGLHLSPYDGDLYYATADGELHRVGYADGVVSGTPETLSGPTVDGLSWGRGLTVYAGDDIVPPNQAPTASFTWTCVLDECSLSATGSSDPDGDIVDHSWDFGDGSTATGSQVDHTFAEGDWTVSLTVTDDDGATGATTQQISITSDPVPDIDATCIGLACTFDGSGSTDLDDPVVSWDWDFGDGTTDSGEVVEHEYATPGTYTVELTVTDDEGDSASTTTDVTVDELAEMISWVGSDSDTGQSNSFDVTVPGDVQAGDLLMLFVSSSRASIGDEAPTGVDGWTNVDTAYNDSATAAVWSQIADGSEAGQVASVSMEGTWTKADVTVAAWRGVDPDAPIVTHAVANETVAQTAHTTPQVTVTGDDAWLVSYWTDRTSGTTAWTAPAGVTVRHEGYTNGGGRASALLADSGGPVSPGTIGGLTATADSSTYRATMWSIALAPSTFVELPPEPPVADLVAACTNLSCNLDASASTGVDDAIVSWDWDFGDGSTGTGEVVAHDYAAEGVYSVAVTVTDTQGLTDTATVDVTIDAAPQASFTVSCDGLVCDFDASASNDAGDPVVSWDWDFGDGATGSGETIQHTYAAEDTYDVALTVVDDEGASVTVSDQVAPTIPDPPVADVLASCNDLTCDLDASASTGVDDAVVAWDWDFGDGSSGTGETTSHVYAAPGTFTVTLTVTDSQGLTDTTTVDVTVDFPPPAADIAFVGSDSSTGQLVSYDVVVPADVQAGDLLMVFVSSGRAGVGDGVPTGVDGWTNVDTVTDSSHTAAVWSKVADGTEAGQTVTVDMEGQITKADVAVAAWRGVDPTSPLLAAVSAAEAGTTADHTTPATTLAVDDAWVVSYWTDKTSATTSWTPPPGVVVRHEGHAAGNGRVSGLIVDSGGPVPAGPVGGLTATADSANGKATMWTLALAPGA